MSLTAPLWTPAPARVAETQLARFTRFVNETRGTEIGGYPSLHDWSVREPGSFWASVWGFADVLGDTESGRPVEVADPFWSTRFFPDARLNVARTLLRDRSDAPAIVFAREDGARRTLTRNNLHDLVSQLQQALRDAGVIAGDRVAALMPNAPETVALMIAVASLGGVFSSTSPDFGIDGVADRFGQIEPKVLVACDAYLYGGKHFDCLGRLGEIHDRLPSVSTVVVVGFVDEQPEMGAARGALRWSDWISGHTPCDVEFESLPFDHPWYVLYSSGTTGVPKCIVHRAGGVLLKHLCEHQLHCDVRAGDRVCYFTTAGWMMWNWLASALASHATLVLYDGSPTFPSPVTLFDLADEVGITLFGTSARFLEGLRKTGLRPVESHSLETIRTIGSTGSPLMAKGFEYVYESVKTDVHLASISGGTDLCGCLVAGDPTGPVWAGEIQRPGLGMDIAVVDDAGRRLSAGERGELVCANPFPSMPLGLWRDPGDVRFRATYFARFPGYWHQGDFAEWTEHGGLVIHGRSDATLNPGGVRIGTAEIQRQIEAIDGIAESLVIGQTWDDDVRIVLFVVMEPGNTLTDELADEIRRRVRLGASPRHVPARIVAVPELPRTRSNKLSELAVRDVVHARQVVNIEALANPESLDYFRDLDELRR